MTNLSPSNALARSSVDPDKATQLRNRLLELFGRLADMRLHLRPQLEARYLKFFGAAELELMEAQLQRRRLQREIELIRMRLARQQDIDTAEIGAILDAEFSQWEAAVAKQQSDMEFMRRFGSARIMLGEEETLRIKEIYRRLVRQLHPDMNLGEETELYRRYWNDVQEAYADGDLERLEALELALGGVDTDLPGDVATLARLRQRIAELEREIVELNGSWPFSLQKQLADAAWVAGRLRILNQQLLENGQAIERLEKLRGQLYGVASVEAEVVH